MLTRTKRRQLNNKCRGLVLAEFGDWQCKGDQDWIQLHTLLENSVCELYARFSITEAEAKYLLVRAPDKMTIVSDNLVNFAKLRRGDVYVNITAPYVYHQGTFLNYKHAKVREYFMHPFVPIDYCYPLAIIGVYEVYIYSFCPDISLDMEEEFTHGFTSKVHCVCTGRNFVVRFKTSTARTNIEVGVSKRKSDKYAFYYSSLTGELCGYY